MGLAAAKRLDRMRAGNQASAMAARPRTIKYIMLVLSRELSQFVVIGDNIVFKMLGVDQNKVRIGIDVPKEVNILHEDIA